MKSGTAALSLVLDGLDRLDDLDAVPGFWLAHRNGGLDFVLQSQLAL
jgi:hypothetical protein